MRGHVLGTLLFAAVLTATAFLGAYVLWQVIDRVSLAFQ